MSIDLGASRGWIGCGNLHKTELLGDVFVFLLGIVDSDDRWKYVAWKRLVVEVPGCPLIISDGSNAITELATRTIAPWI
jgi:hypothetical protein